MSEQKTKTQDLLQSAPLGKQSAYENHYNPNLLFPLPRKPKRDEIGICGELPFKGFDIWTAFEISWLNPKGKPVVAIATITIPAESENIIESKSFKLYLNSFNQSTYASLEALEALLIQDLTQAVKAPVKVDLQEVFAAVQTITTLQGHCLDILDITCTHYEPKPEYLKATGPYIQESVHTNLLKSNCLVTGQPDWGSVEITYEGAQIEHEGLLQYIVSLRNHHEFHEQCVERIFMDIQRLCKPKFLSVYARYTRRGGLDINPFRSNRSLDKITNTRLARQ